MTHNFHFREARREDIPQMKLIRDNVRENRLVTRTIEIPDYEVALFNDGKGWVCTDNNEVIGFSCGRLKQKDVWALFIDHKYEGRGVGFQLMSLLEDWLFKSGCDEIKLTTDMGTRAEKLYRRRGWQYCGIVSGREIEFRLSRPKGY